MRRSERRAIPFLAEAGVPRAGLEALIAGAFLTVYFALLGSLIPSGVLSILPAFLGFSTATLFALRVRVSNRRGLLQLSDELLLAVVVLAAQALGILGSVFVFKASDRSLVGWFTRYDVTALFAGCVVALCVFRAGVQMALTWERARRERLVWSLGGAHVMLILALVWLGVAAWLIWSVATGGSVRSLLAPVHSAGGATVLLAWILPLAVFWFVASACVATLVLPLSAGLSYLVMRPAVRRIELLAQGTRSFRSGKRDTSVEVTGEDEIAQLTQDFNAMAESLSQSLGDLENERDRVAKLLESRRILFAEVSHELRTPIAILRGYLDSINSHWGERPPETLREDLDVIFGETLRLQSLVDDLFVVARGDAGGLSLSLQTVRPAQAVANVLGSFAPLAWERDRVQVVSDVAEDVPGVLADPRRIEQVLFNLVRNAVRHTPPGGLVSLSASADEGFVRLEVRDTGQGISPADASRVWERFYQSEDQDHPNDGAGLGLFIVKELTEAMKGTVHMVSSPDAGSCFSVCLPRA
jgi:signal transduction histidine kinase